MTGRKKSLLKIIGITSLISILVLSAVTYVGISLFFEDHYYYNTYINGEDYSYLTPVEAEDAVYEKIYNYSLEITGREEVYDTILPAEIDMECRVGDALINIKREQKAGLWILGFFKEYSYEAPGLAAYSEETLENKLEQLTFFQKENIRAPSDAYIKYSPDDKEFIIVEASPGTQIIKDKAQQVIRDALDSLNDKIDLEDKGCYKEAAIQKDDETLKDALAKANTYVAAKITYNWNENEVIIDGGIIKDWIDIKKSRVSLNEEKVKEYIAKQALIYDTYGRNKFFHTTDGREIELKSNAFGWLTDQETECRELVKSIKSGETISKEPAYTYTAAQEGQMDIGESYVEIDLGNQHLYLYVEGELVLESDLVSGNASRGWNTPAGVFGLTYKTKNAVLRGEDYATPVSFWMPFNGNIGMHDATWRGSFGGEIYKTGGSHGCINLPYENAKIIYDYMYTGFPVVCYY